MSASEEPPDRDLARRLVAQQFPEWADLPVTDVEHSGWDNRTFRLGDDLTIRLPRSRFYAEQVAKEQRWLPLLAPQPAGADSPAGRPGIAGTRATRTPGPSTPGSTGIRRHPTGSTTRSPSPGAVAEFLVALRECDATDGPLPGQHNWWRGGPLDHYLDEARTALATVADEVDVPAATAILDAAVASTWPGPPVWFHGDIAFGNLLVRDGRLAAVIDFGTSGIGDPACDVVLAWTLLSGDSRDGVPRRPRPGRRHLGPRPGLGTVEGPDHRRREPGHRRGGGRRGATGAARDPGRPRPLTLATVPHAR